MSILILSALVAALAAMAFTIPVRHAALRMQWIDRPDKRKMHQSPVAYGGGIVIVAGIIAGLITVLLLQPEVISAEQRSVAFIIGLLVALLIGCWDDARGLSPWTKIGCQVAIGLGMWAAGFRVEKLTNPFGGAIHLNAVGALLTVGWYVALMNAMNLIDGLDGLAAGVAAIAGATILGISSSWSEPATAVFSAILVGACIGFLPHNFFPARMFLGDGGSLSLGYCLATLALATSTKSSALLALMIPVLALLIPVADAVYAFIRRIKSGRHPFSGDQGHLHHRLLRLGLTHRRVVWIFYYLSAVNGVLAWLLASSTPPDQSSSKAIFLVFAMQAAGFLLLIESVTSLEGRTEWNPDGTENHHD